MARIRGKDLQKAQASEEIILISIVLVGMLLLVLMTTYNLNLQTVQLLEANENSVKCSQISSAIARLYSNRASSKETLYVTAETRLERVEGNQGGIVVGNISCRYIGSVESNGVKDTEGMITLSAGNWCLEKLAQKEEVLVSGGKCS